MAAEGCPSKLAAIYCLYSQQGFFQKTSVLSNLASTSKHSCLVLMFKSYYFFYFNVKILICREKDSLAYCQSGSGNWYLSAVGTLTNLTYGPEVFGLVRLQILGA